MLMHVVAFTAVIIAGLVYFVYAVLWMKKRFQSGDEGFDMFRMWADEPSDINAQISASEELIDFQVAADQPVELETEPM